MQALDALCTYCLNWRENLTSDELKGVVVLLALCLTVLTVFNKRI